MSKIQILPFRHLTCPDRSSWWSVFLSFTAIIVATASILLMELLRLVWILFIIIICYQKQDCILPLELCPNDYLTFHVNLTPTNWTWILVGAVVATAHILPLEVPQLSWILTGNIVVHEQDGLNLLYSLLLHGYLSRQHHIICQPLIIHL